MFDRASGVRRWAAFSATFVVVFVAVLVASPLSAAVTPSTSKFGVVKTFLPLFNTTVSGNVLQGPRITSPLSVVWDPHNQHVYVGGTDTGLILQVGVSKQQITGSFHVPGYSTTGMAFDSKSNRLLVGEPSKNALAIVDPGTGKTVAQPSVGSQPRGVLYDPTNGLVYVANSGASTVSVINPANATLVATITVSRHPMWLAYDPPDNRIFVSTDTCTASGFSVSVINPAKAAQVATVSLPDYWCTASGGPANDIMGQVAYDRANGDVYVAQEYNGTLGVIHASNATYLGQIVPHQTTSYGSTTNDEVFGLAIDPRNGDLLVTTPITGYVVAINSRTNQVASAVFVSSWGLEGVAVANSTGGWYAAVRHAALAVVSPSTSAVQTIDTAPQPSGAFYNPLTSRVYVSDWLLNDTTNRFAGQFLSLDTNSLVLDRAGGRLFGVGSCTIDALNARTNALVGSLSNGSACPSFLAYDARNSRLYSA